MEQVHEKVAPLHRRPEHLVRPQPVEPLELLDQLRKEVAVLAVVKQRERFTPEAPPALADVAALRPLLEVELEIEERVRPLFYRLAPYVSSQRLPALWLDEPRAELDKLPVPAPADGQPVRRPPLRTTQKVALAVRVLEEPVEPPSSALLPEACGP